MKDLLSRYPALTPCAGTIEAALDILLSVYRRGGKLLLCGNGGSAADCEHIAGELGKSFLLRRALSPARRAEMQARCPSLTSEVLDRLEDALPAIPIPSLIALQTAYVNDKDAALAFAQGVLALGHAGDALLAISTSGNSKNVLHAAEVAKALGIKVIALTGEGGGALAAVSDVTIAVPDRETYRVQELHLPIYHWLAAAIERHFFAE